MKNPELRVLIYRKFANETALAKDLGWSKQRLNKITNKKMIPDLNDLDDLAGSLDVSVGRLAEIFLQKESPNG